MPGATPAPAASITPSSVPSAEPTATAQPSDAAPSDEWGPLPIEGTSEDPTLPGESVPLGVPITVVGIDNQGADVGMGGLTLSDGVLAVPAALIAGPGLLVLIWIGLQSVGTLAWAPAVKRLRGENADARPTKRRRGPRSIGHRSEDTRKA